MSESTGSPLDPAQVATLRQLSTAAGPGFLAGLIKTFVERAEQLVVEIGGTTDPAAVVSAAHELKGSSSTIGAAQVAERARTIELRGRAGRVPEPADVVALGEELTRASAALRELTPPSVP